MNPDERSGLIAAHHVVKHVTLALATVAKLDLIELSHLLDAAAADTNLHPAARAMLDDLARGVDLIAQAQGRRPI